MDKSNKNIEQCQRPGLPRRPFNKIPKKIRKRKFEKSEKLKELTELLKSNTTYQSRPDQQCLITPNQSLSTSSDLNFEERLLKTESKNQGDYSGGSLNEYNAKISDLRINLIEKRSNIKFKSNMNLFPIPSINMGMLIKFIQQDYLLSTALPRNIFLEQNSCKYRANFRVIQDKVHQEHTAKRSPKLNACENKTSKSICLVQLKYEKENHDQSEDHNNTEHCINERQSTIEYQETNDLSSNNNNQLVMSSKVYDPFKAITNWVGNVDIIIVLKPVYQNSVPILSIFVFPLECSNAILDRESKSFDLENSNIQFDSETSETERTPNSSMRHYHSVYELKNLEDTGSKKRLSSNSLSNCLGSKLENKVIIDKSRRRKGIYFESMDWAQSAQIHKQNTELRTSNNLNHVNPIPQLNNPKVEKTGNSQDLTSFDSKLTRSKFSTNLDDTFEDENDVKQNTQRSQPTHSKTSGQSCPCENNLNSLSSQLFTQTKAVSTSSKLEHVGTFGVSKTNHQKKLNLMSFECNLKLERPVSEAVLCQFKCCTHLSPSNNLCMNEIQANQILCDACFITHPSAKNLYHKNLFSTSELIAQLFHGSREKLVSEKRRQILTDTRTHIAEEIYRNEQSYVESLQMVVYKYFNVLKSPEYAGMIDAKTVDKIFFMVPDILQIHEKFLKELKKRLDTWVPEQKVGDAFVEIFSKTEVLEIYTSFVSNCNRAKNSIRTAKQTRPSFARFLETTAREHKGKLTLDNLLIKPVQKFPNYEMLFTRLIKHTAKEHPDHKHLQEVLKLVHDILVHINGKEKEILENFQREATLRELESIIEGITDLNGPERQFILFDLVSMPTVQGTRKERGFFLFNDFLLITSVKRRCGSVRKPNTSYCPASIGVTLDTIKYKFLTKVPLEHLEDIKSKEETFRKETDEFEQLTDDCKKIQLIAEMAATIKYPHKILEENIRDIHQEVQNQLSEYQLNETRLNMLDITIKSANRNQHLEVIFSNAEIRCQWEEALNEAKQKLAATLERHPVPEFITSIPLVKTRAGLQFTCAEPTLGEPKEVWVCNSDGYVGQVCVMSLHPEPNVTSCNGVCSAKILCLASVPACSDRKKKNVRSSSTEESSSSEFQRKSSVKASDDQSRACKSNSKNDIKLDSNSSSDDSEEERPLQGEISDPVALNHIKTESSSSEEVPSNQPTMWLGTEDGFVHIYNCTDTIRIKKNKIKIQQASAVYSILHLDNRIFISLANGDLCVYHRDNVRWNTTSPFCFSIGTVKSPVDKLLMVHGKLWCSIQGIIKVLDTDTLQVVHQIQVSSDSKPITNMVLACNTVWISVQNSAHIKCVHANTYQQVNEVNLGPAVNKMLSNCDDIIRQHKAACLRVTSLLSCNDLIWIGTSAGVLLTIKAQGYDNGSMNIVPSGIPYGHTGHVKFLTCVEKPSNLNYTSMLTNSNTYNSNQKFPKESTSYTKTTNTLVISGGDGFEDFRNSGANSLSEIAGREDSTNHLLIWQN